MRGYGFNVDDPVCVSGFYEEHRYLECLRKKGANAPLKYERLGSCGSERRGHPVDVYRVKTRGGLFTRAVTLYVDIYGERDWRPPEGFYLNAPAPVAGEGGKLAEAAENMFRAVCAIAERGGDLGTASGGRVGEK